MFKRRIISLWLIQSQSQRGACSATLHQSDAYGGIDIIIGQVRFQFDNCLLCYFKHPNNLLVKWFIKNIRLEAGKKKNLLFSCL